MKKIFITGMNSNLGSDLLPALLNNGYYVYASYHNINNIDTYKQELEKQVGKNISHLDFFYLDLSDLGSIEGVLKNISDIDIVINNASVRVAGDINDFGIGDYEQIFTVNVFAILEIYKYFSEIFKQKGSGDFINIGSISDKKPFLYDSIYAASKNALNSLNKGFYDEGQNYGYNSTLVYFGPLEKSEKTFLYKKEKYIDYFGALNESQKIKKTYIVKGILDLIKAPVSASSVTIYGDK